MRSIAVNIASRTSKFSGIRQPNLARFGCSTIAKFHFFSPEQDANSHRVQLSWTPVGIIYCIAKEVPKELGDMMHR